MKTFHSFNFKNLLLKLSIVWVFCTVSFGITFQYNWFDKINIEIAEEIDNEESEEKEKEKETDEDDMFFLYISPLSSNIFSPAIFIDDYVKYKSHKITETPPPPEIV